MLRKLNCQIQVVVAVVVDVVVVSLVVELQQQVVEEQIQMGEQRKQATTKIEKKKRREQTLGADRDVKFEVDVVRETEEERRQSSSNLIRGLADRTT